MKRQILTVTMELLVPEDAEQDYPKGYDRMTHIGSIESYKKIFLQAQE